MTKLITTALAAATVMAAGAASAECDWRPERPVSYLVPWGAGGTTDTNARMLATLLQEKFGQPFNVTNRTGGNGVTGHTAIATAKPDGYTIGAATVEMNTMHWFGLTDLTYEDITPISLLAQPAASVLVHKDSPYQSLTELLAEAKANPGKLTASGTSLGGIWHLALAGMLQAEGMKADDIRWIPSQGSASAMQELLAGGVDLITPSLEEGKAMIDAGEVRALSFMSPTPNAAHPEIPLSAQELPSGWTMAAYTSLSGPKGLPEEIACSYDKAVAEITASAAWADFQASRGSPVTYGDSAALKAVMVAYEESLGNTIKAIGMAQ